MRILVRPLKGPNPRNGQLYDRINNIAGVTAEEFSIKKALAQRFDVLHVHWPDRVFKWNLWSGLALGALFVLFAIARLRGAKVVYTCHNILPKNRIKGWELRCYNRIMRFGVDWIISPRRDLVRHIRKLYPRAQIQVVPLGILSVQQTEDHQILGKVFGANVPKNYLLIPGVQERTKQTELAITKIRSALPEVPLLVAGQFPEPAYLIDLQASFSDAKNVYFYDAFLEENELSTLIRRASALIASQVGGTNSGIALLAIAHGKPCYCATERLAVSVRQEYETDLVAPLSQLLSFEVGAAKVGTGPSRWTMDRVAESTIDVYRSAVSA